MDQFLSLSLFLLSSHVAKVVINCQVLSANSPHYNMFNWTQGDRIDSNRVEIYPFGGVTCLCLSGVCGGAISQAVGCLSPATVQIDSPRINKPRIRKNDFNLSTESENACVGARVLGVEKGRWRLVLLFKSPIGYFRLNYQFARHSKREREREEINVRVSIR